MSQPVLVRSSMRTWDLALLLLAGVGLVIVGWLVYENGEKAGGVFLQMAGGASVSASTVMLRRRIRRRQWIRLRDHGFSLLDRNGEIDFEDTQVRSLSLRLKQNSSEGIVTSITRTMLVWIASDDAEGHEFTKLEFTNTFFPSALDPLADLIKRLSQQVLDRARELLMVGSTFSGEGWVLERSHLIVKGRPETSESTLDEIVATGIVDDKLCLWRTGRDEVWTTVNIDSVNAYVLKWLIDERLAERPSKPDSGLTTDGLGRVLFERKPQSATIYVLSIAAFALVLVGAGLFAAGLNHNPMADPARLFVARVACAIAFLGATALILGIVYCRRAVFRCHQFGLVKHGFFRDRVLRYEHVESFTYQATRRYLHGVYVATIFVLDFLPDAEHRSHRIRYTAKLQQADSEMENLRDQVAGIIGSRMQRGIQEGQRIEWTPALTFHEKSLIYSPFGFIARKTAVTIPLAEIESFRLESGQCYLFRRGQKKAAIQENVHTKNFFPGFHCLLSLIQAAASPEAEADRLSELPNC